MERSLRKIRRPTFNSRLAQCMRSARPHRMHWVLLLALGATGPAEDAPMKLYTESGVELRMDERVYTLFAALNAAGFSEESKRRGPPLNAPLYHPVRVELRDALREIRDEPLGAELRTLFRDNPYPIRDYLEAVLAPDGTKLSSNAQKLRGKMEVLDRFAQEVELQKVFDALAEKQREQAKAVKQAVEADLQKAAAEIEDPSFRAPRTLVVVPNPLDSHDAVRTVDIGDTRYVVVGPDVEQSRRQIVEAAIRPYVKSAVDGAWGAASKYRSHWDGVSLSKRIVAEYQNGKNYLVEALTRALTHRAQAGSSTSADEEFVDAQARENMRWARIALRVWDQHPEGTPFKDALPGLVRKFGP